MTNGATPAKHLGGGGGDINGAIAGASVGRYRLEQLVASGGMGEVWQAHDVVLGRPVALLHAGVTDPRDQKRFVTRVAPPPS